MTTITGIQQNGSSNASIKKMALKALETLPQKRFVRAVDLGGGRGDMAQLLHTRAETVFLVDAHPAQNLNGVQSVVADLNARWPDTIVHADIIVALELIEHLENPRHFFRELHRCLKPGGHAFLSTPHNTNLLSRILFLLKGQHRYFQDLSYPAHITALLKIDLERLCRETGLQVLSWHYNHLDVIPGLGWPLRLPFRSMSNSVGLLLYKPA